MTLSDDPVREEARACTYCKHLPHACCVWIYNVKVKATKTLTMESNPASVQRVLKHHRQLFMKVKNTKNLGSIDFSCICISTL